MFSCSTCNKNYTTKTSLTNHNRIKHGAENKTPKNSEKQHHCKFCNATFSFPQSRWVHEKKCKMKNEVTETDASSIVLQSSVIEEMDKMKKQIADLQNKLLKCKRLDNKTFKAVNKILMDRSYKNSQNNNTITNTINNNYQIMSLGNEDLVNVLTLQQKKMIMNSRLGSLEKIVEIAHCGTMNQFKNIIITNLKDNYAYRYDASKGYFVTVPKNTLLEDVVSHRVTDIEAIYDELQTANKIDAKTKKIIQDFLDKIENEDPFFDNETKYDNFKSYKINNIKILLYNNQDKITKDVALLISNTDTETVEKVT